MLGAFSLRDSTKITRELGCEPEVPFERGLRKCARWYAQDPDWWEPLRDRAPVGEERLDE